ncbi:protein insensitive-like [Nymphalis io]|uniref:protein insensitive-like n=1 Tax=Inachis io TaxID=171585 RepID=UPI0021697CA8|nr:protein insensitive-like [Nymphalis io]
MAENDSTSHTSATRQLLQAVFPRRILATHSLTGKQSPAFANKPPKKQLDPKLVDDIVNTVAERCNVSKRIVRSSITTKCSDEAKLYRNRQRYRKKREQQNRENVPPSSATSDESTTV